MKTRAFRSASLLIVVLVASLAPLSAQPAASRKDNWVPTWATSQQLVRVLPQGRGGAPAPAATSPTPQPSAQPTLRRRPLSR